MKTLNLLFLLILLSCLFQSSFVFSQEVSLASGDVTLNVTRQKDNTYNVTFSAYGKEFNAGTDMNPALMIDVKMNTFYPTYTSYTKADGKVELTAKLVAAPRTTVFEINDAYTAKGNGEFELKRNVKVVELGANSYDEGFSSSFGLQFAPKDVLANSEYFIPAVWYKGNFEKEGNIPSGIPVATDLNFLYREDRIPLPVVMMREKASGLTFTLVHKDSKCETVLNDSRGVVTDEEYQFGGVGVVNWKKSDTFAAVVTYPGSDLRTGGLGRRMHPITKGFDKHAYNVYFKIDKTSDYVTAVNEAWELAFNLYNPKIYDVNLTSAYQGLIETVNHYYLDSSVDKDVKGPGFPWSVKLTDFSLNKNTYEIGFVGSQPVAGYALFRAGVETGNEEYKVRGTNVLNLWASESLSELGLPKTRYAALWGTWDDWALTSMRQACNGMVGLLNAWCYAKRNGIDIPSWLAASKKFGDFLVTNQNADGSYYLEYNPFKVVNGRHPAGNQNKFLTICAVRYLVELYIATNDERYKTAALKAAEFSYANIHEKYLYVACVVDNPQTIDSESGQQAINGFLAIYDLTKDPKWLAAAEQAATYTESWSYMFEVPVEKDQTAKTDWPKDRSIVGQHIIAIGHSATDLGFAWSSFVYYRLYLLTGKEHYLHVARISAHNTKQSMNLGQELYPGQPEGLQQEAFQVRVTGGAGRRMNSIMEALTWNFAAHLDPMIRFKDAFGTYDLEEVEAMPKSKVQELNNRYSLYQSSDYGQDPETGIGTIDKNSFSAYISGDQLFLINKGKEEISKVELTDLAGRRLWAEDIKVTDEQYTFPMYGAVSGFYLLNVHSVSGEQKVFKVYKNK
ncbi:hypothetical protein [Bacteroides oleiciplenus]|uniref:hypothetical protein n=1 Tax=Bacteroides oleiciplenus TaxID=626931 RepID=UPI0026DD3958|nr:hypothetical protein [Bacteroides oleiciplenus]